MTPRRRVVLFITAAVIVVGLVIGGLAAGWVLRLIATQPDSRSATTIPVTLVIDGFSSQVTTGAATVRDLLADQGISLHEGLAVAPSLDSAVVAGLTVIVDQERSVTLTVDGLTSVFRTVIDNPQEILNNAGIMVDSDDSIQINGAHIPAARLSEYPLPANSIIVQHAVTVTLEIDGSSRRLTTTAPTIGEALFEAGVALYLGDLVDPSPETPLVDAMTIVIKRSRPITVLADGVSIETRSQAETVGEALAEVGVALNGLDYTLPSEVAMLRPDMTIEVVRVSEDVLTEIIQVPFETVYQADAALELDQTALAQEGAFGVDQRNLRVRYENGVEISRTDEGVTRMQEPVNRVVSYGTQIVLRTIDTPEGPREYWRKLRLYATSYHPAALGGDDVTSIGRKLQKGIVGIDPKLIPYNTTLYVEGYGVGVAADTGGPRSSRYWIDLGYSDADWVSWSRWIDAYLLAPPPENFPYILP